MVTSLIAQKLFHLGWWLTLFWCGFVKVLSPHNSAQACIHGGHKKGQQHPLNIFAALAYFGDKRNNTVTWWVCHIISILLSHLLRNLKGQNSAKGLIVIKGWLSGHIFSFSNLKCVSLGFLFIHTSSWKVWTRHYHPHVQTHEHATKYYHAPMRQH